MIKIKDLTVKNFMSVGNQTQAVDFNKEQLTLVLGENLDQGGDDAGSRNGTGKTTIINALSYALYGNALTNIIVLLFTFTTMIYLTDYNNWRNGLKISL